jgi:hypothetical protein
VGTCLADGSTLPGGDVIRVDLNGLRAVADGFCESALTIENASSGYVCLGEAGILGDGIGIGLKRALKISLLGKEFPSLGELFRFLEVIFYA